MITHSPLLRHRRWQLAGLVLVPVLLLALQGLTFRASAADLDWVDGGDDQLCLQDDTGVALSHPEIEQCSPIIGCETGETNGRAWIRFPTRNGVWQPKGEYKSYLVLYGNEQPPSSTPTAQPTAKPTSRPTTKPTSGPTTRPTNQPTSKPTSKPTAGATSAGGTPTAGGSSAAAPAGTDDLGIDEDEQVAPGAPTAPAAPTVEVSGQDVTVTWAPSADAELEGVTGYVLRFSGADAVETDASTTSHTFKDLPDGNYRAAVRAVNDAGPSPSSPPSDVATVGTPISEVKGTLTVDGDLRPGATVTVSGSGYAPDVPELVLELHSTPIQVGTVATDADGAFSTTVTLPADVEPGEHHLVVLYDGSEITSTAVSLVAATDAEPAADEATVAPTKAVPPLTGLVILAGLAALGFLALGWHLLTGRRRRADRVPGGHLAGGAPLVPSGAGAPATEVV